MPHEIRHSNDPGQTGDRSNDPGQTGDRSNRSISDFTRAQENTTRPQENTTRPQENTTRPEGAVASSSNTNQSRWSRSGRALLRSMGLGTRPIQESSDNSTPPRQSGRQGEERPIQVPSDNSTPPRQSSKQDEALLIQVPRDNSMPPRQSGRQGETQPTQEHWNNTNQSLRDGSQSIEDQLAMLGIEVRTHEMGGDGSRGNTFHERSEAQPIQGNSNDTTAPSHREVTRPIQERWNNAIATNERVVDEYLTMELQLATVHNDVRTHFEGNTSRDDAFYERSQWLGERLQWFRERSQDLHARLQESEGTLRGIHTELQDPSHKQERENIDTLTETYASTIERSTYALRETNGRNARSIERDLTTIRGMPMPEGYNERQQRERAARSSSRPSRWLRSGRQVLSSIRAEARQIRERLNNSTETRQRPPLFLGGSNVLDTGGPPPPPYGQNSQVALDGNNMRVTESQRQEVGTNVPPDRPPQYEDIITGSQRQEAGTNVPPDRPPQYEDIMADERR